MAKARRCMLVLTALCVGFSLSGCAGGNLELDPAYWFPDGKKKLPGDRREVFPEGVPGVTQGIPPELVRGNPAQQAAQEPLQTPDPQQTQPQAQEKPKPRPKKVARPRPAPAPEPESDAQPAPRATQSAPRQAQPTSSGAWPAPQQAQQQPQQQQAPASGAWPAPPAAGTFTR